MKKWETRLEVWKDGQETSRRISIKTGFLQGDSYSPVGYCLSEVPISMLLSKTKGHRMGMSGRTVKRTHSFFIDDLKVYQENHNSLEAVNEMIVKTSHDTGAYYGVTKYGEVVFEHGKMVKGKELDVLDERMNALDPDVKRNMQVLRT